MPLYEYQCNNCGHISEFIEKPGSKKQHKCQRCGHSPIRKIISTFSTGGSSDSDLNLGETCPTGTCPIK